jgi:hypothetical protein
MIVLAVLLAASAAASASATAPPPLAPLDFLAGSCFLGTFADGKTQDLVCYEPMLGGKFLRSRHRILGGPNYSGETILGFDKAKGALEFTYFNSDGSTMRGTIEPTADGLRFPEEKAGDLILRSTWTRTPDGYVATTEKREGEGFKPFMKIVFVRKGPASGWTER